MYKYTLYTIQVKKRACTGREQASGDQEGYSTFGFIVTERKDVLYFHGNMSEGDVLETHKSVVLIGNVEAGARVTTLKT